MRARWTREQNRGGIRRLLRSQSPELACRQSVTLSGIRRGEVPSGTHQASVDHKKKKKKRNMAADDRPAVAAPTEEGGRPPVHRDEGLQDERNKDGHQERGPCPAAANGVDKGAVAAGEKRGGKNKSSDGGGLAAGPPEKKRKKQQRGSDRPAVNGGEQPVGGIEVLVMAPMANAGSGHGLRGADPFLTLAADITNAADGTQVADIIKAASEMNPPAGATKAADVTKAADLPRAAGADVVEGEPEVEARVQSVERASGGKKKQSRKAKAKKDTHAGEQGEAGLGHPRARDALPVSIAYDQWGRFFERKWESFWGLPTPRAAGKAKGQPIGARQSVRPASPAGLGEEVQESGGDPGANGGAASQYTIRRGPLPCSIDGCPSPARFGVKAKGQPLVPSTCTKHRLPTMTECKSAICEVAGCMHKVVYRMPGKKRTRCSTHKEEGMVQKG